MWKLTSADVARRNRLRSHLGNVGDEEHGCAIKGEHLHEERPPTSRGRRMARLRAPMTLAALQSRHAWGYQTGGLWLGVWQP